MKKIVVFALVGLLTISMAGCRPSSKLASLVEKAATETADSGIDTTESVEMETPTGPFVIGSSEELSSTDETEDTAIDGVEILDKNTYRDGSAIVSSTEFLIDFSDFRNQEQFNEALAEAIENDFSSLF